MYRKEIKVLDCTIRDGGLINKWDFSDKFVRTVLEALVNSGIDYMEIGYKASRKLVTGDGLGKWRFCDEDDIRRICDGLDMKGMKLSAMVDVGRVVADEIPPASESIFDMIRVATYVKEIDKAIDLVKMFHDKGYETTVNLMAVSRVLNFDLEEALAQLAESEALTVYVVDSNGSLYCEQVEYLVKKYQQYLPGKTIGIHAHNNQQLAYSNTIEAIIHGANMLDATVYGIGRGAGNCPLELLLGFLKNPKFRLRPVIELIEKEFIPLREKIEWGYLIPYAISGMLDQHPRAAMELRDGPDKDQYTKFFDSFGVETID